MGSIKFTYGSSSVSHNNRKSFVLLATGSQLENLDCHLVVRERNYGSNHKTSKDTVKKILLNVKFERFSEIRQKKEYRLK